MAELLLARFKSCKVTDEGEMSSTLDAISVELGQSEELRYAANHSQETMRMAAEQILAC